MCLLFILLIRLSYLNSIPCHLSTQRMPPPPIVKRLLFLVVNLKFKMADSLGVRSESAEEDSELSYL